MKRKILFALLLSLSVTAFTQVNYTYYSNNKQA